ncbi:hypothetical protein [Flavonifractor phage Chenonceau]|nr:hypothetical protein [Flavonifractor phage Chenonceau]
MFRFWRAFLFLTKTIPHPHPLSSFSPLVLSGFCPASNRISSSKVIP